MKTIDIPQTYTTEELTRLLDEARTEGYRDGIRSPVAQNLWCEEGRRQAWEEIHDLTAWQLLKLAARKVAGR